MLRQGSNSVRRDTSQETRLLLEELAAARCKVLSEGTVCRLSTAVGYQRSWPSHCIALPPSHWGA